MTNRRSSPSWKDILFVATLAAGTGDVDRACAAEAAAPARSDTVAPDALHPGDSSSQWFDDWSPDAPAFRWIEVATFPGELPVGEPWSPAQPQLVFSTAGPSRALQAIDPSAAHPSPWHLVDADAITVGWSPEGTWIAAVVRDSATAGAPAGEEHAVDRTLLAFSADRDLRARATHPLAAGFGNIRTIWAADGKIWYRISERKTNWQFAKAPEEWSAVHTAPSGGAAKPSRTFLTLDVPWTSLEPATCVVAVDTGADWPQEQVLPILRTNEGNASVVDVFPDRDHVLARAAPIEGFGSISVFDRQGRVQARFAQVLEPFTGSDGVRRDRGTFEPTSVSADGALLLGTRRIEDEHGVAASIVCVGDAGGRWVAPLEGAPPGIGPRCAHVGSWVAFRDLEGPVVHLGRIERVSALE